MICCRGYSCFESIPFIRFIKCNMRGSVFLSVDISWVVFELEVTCLVMCEYVHVQCFCMSYRRCLVLTRGPHYYIHPHGGLSQAVRLRLAAEPWSSFSAYLLVLSGSGLFLHFCSYFYYQHHWDSHLIFVESLIKSTYTLAMFRMSVQFWFLCIYDLKSDQDPRGKIHDLVGFPW